MHSQLLFSIWVLFIWGGSSMMAIALSLWAWSHETETRLNTK